MKRKLVLTTIAAVIVIMLVCFAVSVSVYGDNNIAYADSGEYTPIIYTMVDEDGTNWTVTTLDETNCTLSNGTTETNLTYVMEGGVLTLTNPITEVEMSFDVGIDNVLTIKETEDGSDDLGSIVVEAEVDQEKLTEQVKQIISDFLGNYLNTSMVAQIVTWLVDAGVLGALVGIYLKYRKYKKTSIEDMQELAGKTIQSKLGDSFNGLGGNVLKTVNELITKFMDLDNKMDTLLTAFALAQDKSSEGKIAMLKLVQGVTDDEQTVEKIEEIKTEIVAEEEAIQEVEEKVQGTYTDIF